MENSTESARDQSGKRLLGAEVYELLEQYDIYYRQEIDARLGLFCDRVRQWNRSAHLVSRGDEAHLERVHLVDSLSLVPWTVSAESLLDLGSGGGFPAVPLAVVAPRLRLTMVERSANKATFLRKIVEELDLNAEVIQGDFPREVRPEPHAVVTARAVEKPGKLLKAMLRALAPGGVFLCQAPVDLEGIPDTFHVEHVEDAWTAIGLRRGTLRVVRRDPRP